LNSFISRHTVKCILYCQGTRESVLWLAVHHQDKKALELLSREIAPGGTGMGK